MELIASKAMISSSDYSSEALDQAVILAGGVGSRLHPLTYEVPKPLLEVGGRPFMDYLVESCIRFGFSNVILLAGFRANQFARYIENKRSHLPTGVTLELVVEPKPRGTAGALRHGMSRLSDRFILLNGDSFFDINWLDLGTMAREDPNSLVMGLCRCADASRFGIANLKGDCITDFAARGTGPALINAGIYFINRRIVGSFPEDGSLEATVLPKLAAQGRVRGRAYDAYFTDIGTPESLADAHRSLPQRFHRPAAFFTCDITMFVDESTVDKAEEPIFLPGAIAAIKRLNEWGYYVFAIVYQFAIAKRPLTEDQMNALCAKLQRTLRRSGAHFDDIQCWRPRSNGQSIRDRRSSDRRNQDLGTSLGLAKSWPILGNASFVVGNRDTVVATAEASGLRGLVYSGGNLDVFLTQRLAAPRPYPAVQGVTAC